MNSTAIHEAGHCIVGLSFGWKLKEVSISDNDSGRVLWSSSESEMWYMGIPHARRALSVTVAGYLAESRRISRTLLSLAKLKLRPEQVDDDIFQATLKASAICRGTMPGAGLILALIELSGELELAETVMNEIERAEKRAEKILQRFDVELAKLSAAVHERKTLSAKQITKLLKQDKLAAYFG